MWTQHRYKLAGVLALSVLGLLWRPQAASALDISVAPIQVYLAATQKSAMVRIGNPNDEPLTIQVSVMKWTQDANGVDKLEPTNELLAFPQMIQIKPNMDRNIRVGTVNPDRTAEHTYRLLLEPVIIAKTQKEETQVRSAVATVITRSSVPVFVMPTKGTPGPIRIAGRMEKGNLLFEVANPGSVHIMPPILSIKGFTEKDEQLPAVDSHGWYVLPGITRTDTIRLPADLCPKVKRLVVDVANGQQTETLKVPVAPEQCRP